MHSSHPCTIPKLHTVKATSSTKHSRQLNTYHHLTNWHHHNSSNYHETHCREWVQSNNVNSSKCSRTSGFWMIIFLTFLLWCSTQMQVESSRKFFCWFVSLTNLFSDWKQPKIGWRTIFYGNFSTSWIQFHNWCNTQPQNSLTHIFKLIQVIFKAIISW